MVDRVFKTFQLKVRLKAHKCKSPALKLSDIESHMFNKNLQQIFAPALLYLYAYFIYLLFFGVRYQIALEKQQFNSKN